MRGKRKKKSKKSTGRPKSTLSEKDRELARKVIDKIRTYHRHEQNMWKARAMNKAYLLMQDKLLRWIYVFFSSRFITLDEGEKVSLAYECFYDVVKKFEVERSRQYVDKFFVNMHRLILWRLHAYYRRQMRDKVLRNEDVDPDEIPQEVFNERTFELKEFIDQLRRRNPDLYERAREIVNGEYKKFDGNVYQWGKSKMTREWFQQIMEYLGTYNKWGKRKGD